MSESKPAENKTAAPENKPAQKPQANEQNKPAEGAKTENAEQRPKKKSSITAVFNAQYSKQAAAAAAITTDVLEMVTDARGMRPPSTGTESKPRQCAGKTDIRL